jgi:hypothetical protein
MTGLAATVSWLDWRWVLLSLSAASVVLPCGLLARRGRLDPLEPLTWFALIFLLLFVLRPAWDLAHGNFVYDGRLISPTFTKMLVAGLLAGSGFVVGYLAPAAGSLASRLPDPPRVEPRRLLIWAAFVLAVAVAGFATFFVQAHAWREPAQFFLRSKGWLQEVAATPTATSKYFIASIVLMIPAVLLFLSVRHGVGAGTRLGRIAKWAALASILAFLAYNLAGGQRHYVIDMLGALAAFYYLRRERRPSMVTLCAVALMALTVVSVVRDLRDVPALDQRAEPSHWLPWNASGVLLGDVDTGVAPALATEMLVVPNHLDYTYGETTLLGPFVTAIPRQLWPDKPQPADQQVIAAVWGGRPCTYGGPCATFSPFGAPYRDGGLVGVFLFALLFGAFWRTAWLYYLRHRDRIVAIAAYSMLIPFMITWMRGNLIFAAMEVVTTLAVVVVGVALCRTRTTARGAVSKHDAGWQPAGGRG